MLRGNKEVESDALITIVELEQLTQTEHEDLHLILFKLLMATKPNSAYRRNLFASLENIEAVLDQKQVRQIGYNRV